MSKPWMPLYVADYRKDTAHLSAAQHGAYLLLIMHYWACASLPDDDGQLARIAAMTLGEWRRARPVVQAFFHEGWRHKRIDVELAHAEQVSSKRRAAAEQKHSKRDANAPANADQLHTHARATSQPQPPSEEETSSSSGARKRASRLPSDWAPDASGLEYARQHGLAAREIDVEAEKFRNYWTAKSGKDAAKTADIGWPATWRNWILNAIERKGQPNGTGPRGSGARSPAGDFFAGIAEVAANIGGDGGMAGPADEDLPRGRFEIDH